jgi:tetratricopeptide (TPR) repeat protein
MTYDPFLNKAAHLAKRRDYEGALKMLKSEEERYYGYFKYYYLCSFISLYSGAYEDAHEYFHQARQIKMKDPSTLLGLAVLSLWNMKTVRAVDYYLDVQESDPKNKIAKRALAVIRKHSDSDSLSDWLMVEKLSKLFPPIPGSAVSSKTVFCASVILAAVFIAALGIFMKPRVPQPASSRPNANEFVLSQEERKAPVETGGSYGYILTRAEATDLYDKAHSFFKAYRDEAAKINLNRILASNASEGLKNKSRIMISYMTSPGFDNFKQGDNVPYAQAVSEPALYRDVYVIWRGMATNVEVTDEHTTFDFLVGYDTRTKLEGIVPVVFKRPVALNNERPLEVLGKIVVTNTPPSGLFLEGEAIHQSARLEDGL